MNAMNAHLEILPADTGRTVSLLTKCSLLSQFYLAGGTAVALHLGHRLSADLDFFSTLEFDESILIQKLSSLGTFHVEKKAEQTVIGILENTKLSFIGYKYPLLKVLKTVMGVQVADIRDIACMKIDTIASRGAKRDFIDLYFIVQEAMPLPDILKCFKQKYASIHYNMMHIKKSLVYFVDAESEPLPHMIKQVHWGEVKAFFQEQVAKLPG